MNLIPQAFRFSSIQSPSHVWLFATPWIVARQASRSITNSWSPPKPMSIELVMPPNHLIFCCPLLLLPSIFPSIRVFSNGSWSCKDAFVVSHFSCVWLFVTLWTVAHQALLFIGFSRQEYWSRLLCPPPGDLPNLGIKLRSHTLQADSLPSQPPGKPKLNITFL